MSSYGRRLIGVTLATAIVCVAIGLYIGLYLTNVPGSRQRRAGPAASRTCTSGRFRPRSSTDPHPTWVSYYVVNAASTSW